MQLLLTSLFVVVSAQGAAQIKAMPHAVAARLDAAFPGWTLAKAGAEPTAAVRDRFSSGPINLIQADFDGNGRADYALLIEYQSAAKRVVVRHVIAFLDTGTSLVMYRIAHELEPDVNRVIVLRRRGQMGWDLNTNRKFVYRRDAINLKMW
jgi:hypothetical protein